MPITCDRLARGRLLREGSQHVVRLSASFDTMIQVEQGSAISGCMLVHRPLYGSGRLSGESRPSKVTFSVPSSVGVIRFTGTRTGESIAGTYVVQRNGIWQNTVSLNCTEIGFASRFQFPELP